MVNEPEQRWMVCDACGGDGAFDEDGFMECPKCEGRGETFVDMYPRDLDDLDDIASPPKSPNTKGE